MDGQKTSWATFVLVMAFGMGSWVAINGLWSELFVLIPHTAEQYKLTAYLTVIVQLANIGPIAYTIAEKLLRPERRLRCQSLGVAAIVTVGTLACVLLSQLWRRCSLVGGVEHSTALIALAFFLALVDCTSSVVFLPFLAHFPAQYLSALYIGEGLSGLLPSALALIQYQSQSDSCSNGGNGGNGSNSSSYQEFPGCNASVPIDGVRFQPSSYFGALAAMMVACGLAFAALRWRVQGYAPLSGGEDSDSSTGLVTSTDRPAAAADGDPVGREGFELSDCYAAALGGDAQGAAATGRRGALPLVLMLAALAWVCMLSNGVLPAISSYAYLPYGRRAFLLATVAGIVTSPLTSFLFFWLPSESRPLLGGLVAVLSSVAGYVLYLAAHCHRPLACHTSGTAVLLILVIVFSGCTNYVKVLVSTVARRMARANGLLWCGIVTQFGSFVGAIVAFSLTEAKLFPDGTACA